MRNLLPPLCLLIALAMVITAFAVGAVEPPAASVELHRARAAGDEDVRDVLEGKLKRQKFARQVLLGCLFAGSGLMIFAAFATMRPAGAP